MSQWMSRGLSACSASKPKPIRSAVPGRRLWMNTSARSTSRWTISRPRSQPASMASECLPPFSDRNVALSPPQNGGPQFRVSSPPSIRSSLTTSAPSERRISVANGPAIALVRSTTRIPSSAAAMRGDSTVRAVVSDSGLTPLAFLERSASVWAGRPAAVEGDRVWTYAEHFERVARAAGALGVEPGDRVATLLPNTAAMLELHYAVPGAGAVLVPLNVRLAAPEYAYILEHSGARVVFASEELRDVLEKALRELDERPRVVWDSEYDALLADAEPRELRRPDDERALLSINYTSGTTGRPKGVMTSHRGAYLHSLGVIAEAGLVPGSTYLWTLPMFHCNGWAYTWAVTAAGALHACLPRVEPDAIWDAIAERGVTHLCAAPTVVVMMLDSERAAPCPRPVRLFIGGAPPSPTLLSRAADLNIEITHLYGLTETYGPIGVCAWDPDWSELPADEQAAKRARQGVGTIVSERIRVVDEDMGDVPRDGETLGEVVMRGNNVMLGYYRDEEATDAAFRGGWFHSGDLAVMHPDGYVELRDRLKDVVISGGENITTIEVEQALTAHPARRRGGGDRRARREVGRGAGGVRHRARRRSTSTSCATSCASGSRASRCPSGSRCSTSCRRRRRARSRSSRCASASVSHPQHLRAAERDVRVERDLLLQQAQAGEAPGQLLERQRGLEPPQRRADAEVDPAPERQRAAGVRALRVEAVGLREHAGVAPAPRRARGTASRPPATRRRRA